MSISRKERKERKGLARETICTNQLVVRLVLRSLGEGGRSAQGDPRLIPRARGERESERRSEMIDGVIEKPIYKIRYPNVAKKTRRLMILATVEFVALFVVLVAVEKLMPLDA